MDNFMNFANFLFTLGVSSLIVVAIWLVFFLVRGVSFEFSLSKGFYEKELSEKTNISNAYIPLFEEVQVMTIDEFNEVNAVALNPSAYKPGFTFQVPNSTLINEMNVITSYSDWTLLRFVDVDDGVFRWQVKIERSNFITQCWTDDHWINEYTKSND